MKESAFVKENTARWKAFEAQIKGRKHIRADDLAANYISITDDLAYASTFYPDSNTTRYLNQLSHSFHAGIYKNKRERLSRFITFFTREVPEAIHHSHPQLLYSLAFFLIAVFIGVISSVYDTDFPRIILGNEYVDMSLKNIKHGDPMAVYKGLNPGSMFVGIAVNNIRVSFVAFVMGITLSVGTVYFLLQNGFIVFGNFNGTQFLLNSAG